MRDVKKALTNAYLDFIYDSKEELKKSKELLRVIDSIEYKTKKNGKPYAKTEDNIKTSFNCRLRFDRGFKWLDVHGAELSEMWRSHYVAVFDCKQSLDYLKKEISNYRKNLVRRIEKDEQAIKMTFEEFIAKGMSEE